MLKINLKSGFTLIELLVVVAVIGVLASVVLASLNTARIKGRDARRMSDLVQIRTALEMFFADNGYYPQSGCGWNCNGYRYSYIASTSWDLLAADLAPYIKTLPKDPINSNCPPWSGGCYSYAYGNVERTGSKYPYDLVAQLEDTNSPYRCGIKGYKFSTGSYWCIAFGGIYSNQLYETR